MKKRTFTYLSLLLLVFICFSPTIASSAYSYTVYAIADDVRIKDAYYTDSDGDYEEDDIEAIVKMDFTVIAIADGGDDERWFYTVYHDGSRYFVDKESFLVIVKLILPSGLSYSYAFEDKTTRNIVTYQFFFYNHATESGDYHLEVDVYGYYHSHEDYRLVFDPPGGKGGIEPQYFEYFAF